MTPVPPHYSPIALSRPQCARCFGLGVVLGRRAPKICPCVTRRLEKALRSLTPWESLWLEARRFPSHFPPHPVPGSNWGAVKTPSQYRRRPKPSAE